MAFLQSGVQEKNIIIWDRNDRDLKSAGYSPDTEGSGVRCFGTADNAGFEDAALPVGSKETHLSKILTQQTNAMINIPLAKNTSHIRHYRCHEKSLWLH